MMKTKIITMSILIAWATSLFAQNSTREQADVIVLNYVQSEAIQSGILYANVNEPDEEGITITTSNGETFRAKYACWAYCIDENEPAQRRYLFVKKDGGSLLEVIASNDLGELDASWIAMNTTGLTVNERCSLKLLYPNPVDDWLTIPCSGEHTRVEIYDLKGTRLFSGILSGENACRLNISFLSTGVYLVSISGEMYRIIKK